VLNAGAAWSAVAHSPAAGGLAHDCEFGDMATIVSDVIEPLPEAGEAAAC
jgi:hypothetical protein